MYAHSYAFMLYMSVSVVPCHVIRYLHLPCLVESCDSKMVSVPDITKQIHNLTLIQRVEDLNHL